MNVSQLVPKASPDIEAAIASPWGLYEMLKFLKSKGVEWTEPPGSPLTSDELRDVVRVILRTLRIRENSPAETAICEECGGSGEYDDEYDGRAVKRACGSCGGSGESPVKTATKETK